MGHPDERVANDGEVVVHGAGRPNEWNNYAPRDRLAYALTDKTVIRAGGGKAHAENITSQESTRSSRSVVQVDVPNDGRADFA